MTNTDTPEDGEGARPDLSASEHLAEPISLEPKAEPDLLGALEAEKADLKERLLRSLAEMENLRRRSEREAADARTYAVTSFARDMLTVADNIRRAIESAPKASGDQAEAMRPLMEGMELTERDLLKTLQRHGVRPVDAEGSKFDPNMHQAMFEVARDDVPGGTVVQVIQPGYAIGDRVLRPALVGIAKAAPRSAAPPPGEPQESPDAA